MIHNSTQLIKNAFDNSNIKSEIQEADNLSAVVLGFSGNNYKGIRMLFVSDGNGNDVTIRTDEFAQFPKNKMPAGIMLMNALNQKYRYVKFLINMTTGGVCLQYDIPLRVDDNNLGPVACEILLRTSNLLDDAYPEIMKSIWS